MFVNCFAEKPLVYHNYGKTLILNPGVNCIDELIFPIEDLIRTYGYAVINVIGREQPKVEETKVEEATEQPKVEETKVEEVRVEATEQPKVEIKKEAPKKPARKPVAKKAK